MHRFTLLHDGSTQSWQTAYLAFHIATRLGAPLQVLLISDSKHDQLSLSQQAAQIETGGRAAGVAIETTPVTNFSLEGLRKSITAIAGLFAPLQVIPDGKTATAFLITFSCPLWVVSKEANMGGMAVLVNDLHADGSLIAYTKTLSRRLQQPLSGLIKESDVNLPSKSTSPTITWVPIPSFSLKNITLMLEKLNIGLLFVSASNSSMMTQLPCNCVIIPKSKNA